MSQLRFLAAASLCILILAASGPCLALTAEERAGARAAAEEGANAFDAGRYQEAIDYFDRAEKLIHAPTHLLYIARAHAALGELVAAREAYLKIDREQLDPGAPRVFVDAQELARAELEKLEPRIPRVSVVVQGGGDGPVEVLRDGQPIPSPLIGIPQPMDPGEHSFQAQAPGAQSAIQKITLSEGAEETVLLTLRPKPNASNPVADAPAEPADPGASGGWSGKKIAGYSAIGLGVVGAAVGTVFVIQSSDTRAESDALFQAQMCGAQPGCSDSTQEDIRSLDSDANSQLGIGIAGLAVGGAALATGVTLLILDARSKPETAGAEFWPVIGFGTAGVAGRF